MERTFEKINPREVEPFVLVKKRSLVEGFATVWTTVKMLLLVVIACYVTNGSQALIRTFPIPMKLEVPISQVKKVAPVVLEEPLKIALRKLGCPTKRFEDIYYGIKLGAQRIHVDPLLILALLFTESRFDPNAVSPKGYVGYMQTKHPCVEFGDVEILYGCRKLQEKMRLKLAKRNGKVDMRIALALYKGGLSKRAFYQADEVLAMYARLKTMS